MKKVLFTILLAFSVTLSRASESEIIAEVVIENVSGKAFTSGKLFISELNQVIEVTSAESFIVKLPKKGKYKFGFYTEDFDAYTYYPARITDRKNTVTIQLRMKPEEMVSAIRLGTSTRGIASLSNEQLGKEIKEGKLNFILHGISSSPVNFTEFKNKYGIGFATENCVIDPVIYKRTTEHNLRIVEYLTEMYGADWLKDLPAKPFGLN